MQTKNEREIAMSDKKFADFQLQPYLLTAIQKINFRQPTPVQQRVIPVIINVQHCRRRRSRLLITT